MTYEEHLREAYNEGYTEGYAIGKKIAAMEMVKRLLRMGKPVSDIIEYLKISKEEFRKLKEELSKETLSETDDEPFNLKVRETMEEVHRLGRPLTDEEMEKFKY